MEITVIRLVAALLLLAVPAYLLMLFDAKSLRPLAVALVRMVVQTALVGGCVWALYYYDSVWLTLLCLAAYACLTGWMVQRRSGVRLRVLLPAAVAGVAASTLLVGAYVVWVVFGATGPLSTRWLVPVVAVLLAHQLNASLQAVATYYGCLMSDGQKYYTAVGNGAPHLQAVGPYVRRALQAVVRPAVAQWSTVGLVAVPWLVSGQLLGGAPAVQAVVVAVVLFVACLSASLLSVVLTLWLADRRTFTREGRVEDGLMEEKTDNNNRTL